MLDLKKITSILFLIASTDCFVLERNVKTGCNFTITKALGKPTPLLLVPGTTKVVQGSDRFGSVTLNRSQNIELHCPGVGNYLKLKGFGHQRAIISCFNGTEFSLDGNRYDIYNFTCSQWPSHFTAPIGKCNGNNTLIAFGFNTTNGFTYSMEACHDTVRHHTEYTKFVLTKYVYGSQRNVERSDWSSGEFFVGLDPTNLYKRVTQRATISEILGSEELGKKYISDTTDFFLSKGHMTAKGDYFYGTHQLSTFWYMNAAPQWQTFNGRNWNELEISCRYFTGILGQDVEVYTGTYGTATLPNINLIETNLYLSSNDSDLKMPVPRIYWKVLYLKVETAGIAFIGFNNPYQSLNSIKEDIFCKDICDKVNWLSWDQFNITKGYSLCCEVNEFRKTVKELPNFNVTKLLF